MRHVWHLSMIEIKIMLRDKLYFFWTLLFPLFFIFVFGNLYKGDSTDVKASLLVMNQDQGQWGDYFVEQLKSPSIDLVLVEKEPETYNRILIIPAEFSENIQSGTAQEIIFRKDRNASMEAAAQVETRIMQAIAKVITELILHPDTATFFQGREEFRKIIQVKSRFPEGAILEVPSGFDHVVPGTLVQFLIMMVLVYGGVSIMFDRKRGILSRVLYSPVSIPQLWTGKFMARLLMGIIQAFILLATGKIFFSMNLGNVLLTFLTVFFFSMTIASLGLLIGSILHKEDIIVGIAILLSILFAGLGGCWWPIEIVSATFRKIAMFVPSYWAMDAFHQIIFFKKGLSDLLLNFVVLFGYTVVFSLLSFKFFKIKD